MAAESPESAAALNYGIVALNPAPVPPEGATIAATGMGRSGTTMVARVLLQLGVDMGPELNPRYAEDDEIVTLLKARDYKGFARLCADRSDRSPVWGFKCPALRDHLKPTRALMRNPRYVFVFRDAVAIGQRNHMATGQELCETIRLAANGYAKLMKVVPELSDPVLMVSYEKALQFPEQLVATLARFCGVEVSAEQVKSIAQATVRNADPAYFGTASKDPSDGSSEREK